MSKLKLRHESVHELKAAPWNPRRISEDEMASLKRSLTQFGAVDPVVVNADGTILGGHQRIEAARQLGWDTFPIVRVDLSDADAKLLNIALNRISGEWDEERLSELLLELSSAEADLELSGFRPEELSRLLDEVNGQISSLDAIPALPKEAVTQPGDLWELGEHRLICGDATDPDTIERLLAGETPTLVVTDPPYGVNYDPAWRQKAAEEGKLACAARRAGELTGDNRTDWAEVWKLLGAGVIYCWSGSFISALALETSGFEIRAQIIWAKRHFPISRGHYHYRHEPCWYAVRKGAKAHWVGGRKQTTLWDDITLDANVEGGHSKHKPVELFARAMRNHNAPLVCDPFVGTGTAIVAAELESRRCLAVEIEPRYVDVSIRRWQHMTGRSALRDGAAVEALL